MMLAPQHLHHHHHHLHPQTMDTDGIGLDYTTTQRTRRKRKAETPPENNERLSKRLSLLNLEQNGQKLYVPVESATTTSTTPVPAIAHLTSAPAVAVVPPSTSATSTPYLSIPPPVHTAATTTNPYNDDDDDTMHLDDTRHKVYIYNLDDELSASETEDDDNSKLVFLPDIDKHLRKNRIPPHVLARRPQSAAEGMELVLYDVPRALSVPEEEDGVRRAVLEARARLRERQQGQYENGDRARRVGSQTLLDDMMVEELPAGLSAPEDDPDAMELD